MKKPNSKLLLLLSIFYLLSFSKCALENDDILPDYDIELGGAETHSISGVVVDENDQAVFDAQVDIMGTTTETDENGFFYVDEAKVYAKHAYVKVVKDGYFLGSRSFYPTKGNNLIDIKLLKKNIVGSFDAAAGGKITFESVNIEMGSGFVTESGDMYTGKVNVRGKFIDPTSEDAGAIMPGSLRAASMSGESLLSSFGMMAVELTGDNGSHLQLAEGNTAEITSPIPAGLSSDAPSTTPLWYFDEDKGYWIEEGEATKVGNAYVGTVKHFSFWNCDIPIDAREANGTIYYEDGSPAKFVTMYMNVNGARSASGNTDEYGRYRGLMPINRDISLSLRGGQVKVAPHKLTINIPSSGKVDDIIIPNSAYPIPVYVTGRIIDCESKNTDDVLVLIGGRYSASTTDGAFTIKIPPQTTQSVLLRSKTDYLLQKIPPFKIENSNIDLGDLMFCPDPPKEQLDVTFTDKIKSISANYSIDGNYYSFDDAKVGENKSKGQMSIVLPSNRVTTGTFLEVTMLSDFRMDGQPHYYTFHRGVLDKWKIDFSTSNKSLVEPILPNSIRVDFHKWDLSPGGSNKIIFSGEFEEYGYDKKEFVRRVVEQGNIEFTMED
jgi:hypothetical protein